MLEQTAEYSGFFLLLSFLEGGVFETVAVISLAWGSWESGPSNHIRETSVFTYHRGSRYQKAIRLKAFARTFLNCPWFSNGDVRRDGMALG